MSIKRRKKNTRQRGNTTHGWGAMKKHRGAGHRGGRGNAGSGKRGDAKKPSYWKDPRYAGKFGFTSKSTVQEVTINCGHLCSIADRLVLEGKAQRSGKAIVVDLNSLGYTTLLGGGIVTMPLQITVGRATEKAIEKIEKLGGKVTETDSDDEFEDAAAEGVGSSDE